MTGEAGYTRFQERLKQYRSALALFKAIDAERRVRALNDAEKAGLVQFFELTVELGWKALGALLRVRLSDVAITPMSVLRAALGEGLITDGDAWAAAVKDRNTMAHVYDAAAFDALVVRAGDAYIPIFEALVVRLADPELE